MYLQIAKAELVSAFKREDLGNWLKKPMEQDQFMVPEWLVQQQQHQQMKHSDRMKMTPQRHMENKNNFGFDISVE